MLLGQPTDKSITVNARADAALEMYFEYGGATGVYGSQTKAALAMADPYANGFFVLQSVLTGLKADTQYFYRMQSRTAGATGSFTPGKEYSFHTQRQPGSTFVFCVQGDSHPEREKSMFDPRLYTQTLSAVAAEKPDFYITSGDDFSVDTLPTPYTQASVTGRYTLQLPYLDLLARTTPVFLGSGNHEEASLSNYNLPPDSANSNQVPIWAQNARNLYYSMPGPNDAITGTFYSGNETNVPRIGILRDYYAWQWGDALFAVIDPYWSSPAQVDTGLGGQSSVTPKSPNKWDVTHGDAQYQWLKQTLEQSTAKWKFVFAHHVMGTGRGGIEVVPFYEWGGENGDGTPGFGLNRPTWAAPIHQLLVANHATIFFQAHDHLFARQQMGGITYQSLPNPADNTYTAFNADAYLSGDEYANAGYTKVTVSAETVKVEYIREWLPADEKPPSQVSGMVQFAYTIPGGGTTGGGGNALPAITSVANAESGEATVSPNTWVEIKGTNLAPAGDTRIWRAADFVNGKLPTALDGVSVTVGGVAANVYYISPTQIDILTPPDAVKKSVVVQVTVNGVSTPAFTAAAAAQTPSFFVINGGPYLAATHADGSLIGPATLYPGSTTPAKPGETVVLYGNGFGALTTPPTIRIGGAAAAVTFAGLVSPGEFQFNVVVPPNAADGDLTITATSSGSSTQSGTLLTVKR